MKININGSPRTISECLSVERLLAELQLHPERVVIELNRQILERDKLQTTELQDNDSLEIIHFVGGG